MQKSSRRALYGCSRSGPQAGQLAGKPHPAWLLTCVTLLSTKVVMAESPLKGVVRGNCRVVLTLSNEPKETKSCNEKTHFSH